MEMKAERSGGGERDRKSIGREKKQVIFSMREGRVKKQEGNGKVWVGKERLVRRKVGEGRGEFYHGVQ